MCTQDERGPLPPVPWGSPLRRPRLRAPRAPSPRPSLPENKHDSGKCAHTGLALKLVVSVPCPPPHAPSPPQGPASRKGPTAHFGARAPQALSSRSRWSWDTAWGIPGPSPGTAHPTSALQTQGSSHSALDTRSSPPWNALTTQAQARGRPQAVASHLLQHLGLRVGLGCCEPSQASSLDAPRPSSVRTLPAASTCRWAGS